MRDSDEQGPAAAKAATPNVVIRATSIAHAHRVLHLGHPDSHVPGYEMPEMVASAPKGKWLSIGFLLAIVTAVGGFLLEHFSHGVPDARVALPWVIPFAVLLAGIATMPFIAKHWWEDNYARVAIALGGIVAVYYLFFVQFGPGNVARAAAEYISFIFLLGSLFIVSGGILIRVRARATPTANTVILLIGAIIANLFGTTGASMLLIRPFIRLNKGHLRAYHIVFFIFVVANAGGSLTPIGDPPLFLGYLKGVPFFWVFENCWPIWLVVNGLLLLIFWIIDKLNAARDSRASYDGDDYGPAVSFYGATNLLFITLILVGILGHATLNKVLFHGPWREMLMALAAFASLATTPRRVHGENVFNFGPIKEVAFLFVGIFLTMVPALNYLYNNSNKLPLKTPGQYYFLSGTLSSVLDNAPTYMTFFQMQLGSLEPATIRREMEILKDPQHVIDQHIAGLDADQIQQVRDTMEALQKYLPDQYKNGIITDRQLRVLNLVSEPKLNGFLVAISMGSVLFGAMTYIGNGPNFMVKSIAENTGAPTPSFFGYIFGYSLPILLPVLIVVWLLFLR